jgi:hypothetical protein
MNKFMLTRALKEPKGPIIKRILVRCPSTGKLTPTGDTVEEALWADAKIKKPKLRCPHCSQVHLWTKKDVVLAR